MAPDSVPHMKHALCLYSLSCGNPLIAILNTAKNDDVTLCKSLYQMKRIQMTGCYNCL